MKDVRQNQKDVKIGIVSANNHYGSYGPGTVDNFREDMDMEKLSDIAKINRQLGLENRFNLSGRKQSNKGKQTTLLDFVN
jgi:hypothetical protein